jgi:hypothetical protein
MNVPQYANKKHACRTFVASWTKPQSLPQKLEKNLGTAKGYLEHTKKRLEKVSKKMESIVTGLEKEINDSVQSLINVVGLFMSQHTGLELTHTTDQGADRTAQGRHGKG